MYGNEGGRGQEMDWIDGGDEINMMPTVRVFVKKWEKWKRWTLIDGFAGEVASG